MCVSGEQILPIPILAAAHCRADSLFAPSLSAFSRQKKALRMAAFPES